MTILTSEAYKPDMPVVSELQRHLQLLARFDADTGFLTYDALLQTIDQFIAKEQVEPMALIELRVRGLARIEDAHGRSAVGFIIRQMAERLTLHGLEHASLGRIDHKTFAVFLHQSADPMQAMKVTKTLISLCAQSYIWNDFVLDVEVCAGIALVDATCREATTLIRYAALATRSSLEPGGPSYSFFNLEDLRAAQRKNELVAIVAEAVQKQQFSLVYQPFFEFKTGKLAGFEALLRLKHARLGFISPAEFIPIAEEFGLITKLGAWVIEEACRVASHWPSHLMVSVNFSPAQFYSGTLLADVHAALELSSFPAYRLEIEITEGTILRDQEMVLSQLAALGNMGCSIALDDFGTGYSSLSYLWRFPFSKLKIDRSFIWALDTTPKAPAILKSIMFLSQSLGHAVTAEGIETIAQMETLRDLGCDYLQGYLCGKPADKTELAAIILKNFAERLKPVVAETAAEQPMRTASTV